MISCVIAEIFKFRIIFLPFFRITKFYDFPWRVIVLSGNLFVYKLLLNFLEKSLDLDLNLSLALTQFVMRIDYRFCYKRLQTSTWMPRGIKFAYKRLQTKSKMKSPVLSWQLTHFFKNLVDLFFNQSDSHNIGRCGDSFLSSCK